MLTCIQLQDIQDYEFIRVIFHKCSLTLSHKVLMEALQNIVLLPYAPVINI